MVLHEFDEIIKKKYDYYKEKNPEKIVGMNFNQLKNIGINKLSNIFDFYFSDINKGYIQNILMSDKIHIITSSIENNFSLSNIMSILIYHKIKSSTSIKYYILLLGTHEKFRNLGYGKIILDEFIEKIKLTDEQNINKKILVKSLESSLNFYKSYGFIQANLQTNKLFYKYEPIDDLKSNLTKILELNI